MNKKPWYKSYTLIINGLVVVVAWLHQYLPFVDEVLPVLENSTLTTTAIVMSIVNIVLRFKTKSKVVANERNAI